MQVIQADIIPVIKHLTKHFTTLPGRSAAQVHTDLPDMTMDFRPFDLQALIAGLLSTTLKNNYQQHLELTIRQDDPSHVTLLFTMMPLDDDETKPIAEILRGMQAQWDQGARQIEIVLPITNHAVFWSANQVLQLYIKN